MFLRRSSMLMEARFLEVSSEFWRSAMIVEREHIDDCRGRSVFVVDVDAITTFDDAIPEFLGRALSALRNFDYYDFFYFQRSTHTLSLSSIQLCSLTFSLYSSSSNQATVFTTNSLWEEIRERESGVLVILELKKLQKLR